MFDDVKQNLTLPNNNTHITDNNFTTVSYQLAPNHECWHHSAADTIIYCMNTWTLIWQNCVIKIYQYLSQVNSHADVNTWIPTSLTGEHNFFILFCKIIYMENWIWNEQI